MIGAPVRAGLRRVPATQAWQGRSAFTTPSRYVLAGGPSLVGPPAAVLDASTLAGDAAHPLADDGVSRALRLRADEISAAFDAIEPTLRGLAAHQFDADFVERANRELAGRLGFTLPPASLATTWSTPLAMNELYARCVVRTFSRLVERRFDRDLARMSDGERADALIERWVFHAVDISPCADGRLSGVVDYILRVPPAVIVARHSYAGALFDVERTLRDWEAIELRRWRDGHPNSAAEPTRYLKIAVYHFSSADPRHAGCAAHGSDEVRAATAVIDRLERFAAAVSSIHGPGAAVATLAVGVDTDTDAIRVHVPDIDGTLTPSRFVDNATLYESTRNLTRDAAKDAIRSAVALCAGVSDDEPGTAGMRWFCGYLLKNNLGQVDAVRTWYGGAYADRGHTERLIVAGDGIDDVQLRNLAFTAQWDTVEEGAADLDIGIRILRELHASRHVAVPVIAHVRFDPRIPGADGDARRRAARLRSAIVARYADLAAQGGLWVEAIVRAGDGTALATVDPLPPPPNTGALHA